MPLLRRPPKMNATADYAISAFDLGVRYDLRFTKKTTIRSSFAQMVGRGHAEQFWALRHVELRVQRGESLAALLVASILLLAFTTYAFKRLEPNFAKVI